MRRRRAIALVLCIAGLAGIASSQAIGAGPSTTERAPTQLWEQFPLDPKPQAAANLQTRTTASPAPTAAAGSSGSIDPVVWIVGGLLLLGVPLVLLAGRRRHGLALRVPPLAAQTGTFVPLSPAFRERTPPRRPEPEPEPEPESPFEPVGPIHVEDRREPIAVLQTILGEPEAAPEPEPEPAAPRVPQAIASTYEIVWYRVGGRLVFGLQPLDGRATRAGRVRSASFRWDEDDDPPPSLRDAQRAHGRLRSRLIREGWTTEGRGRPWFSHRFRPPER